MSNNKKLAIHDIQQMSYKSLYFADELFSNIPDKIRIITPEKIEIKKLYDSNNKPIDDSIGNIYLHAIVEDSIQRELQGAKKYADLIKSLLIKEYRILGFPITDNNYNEYKHWVKNLLDDIKHNPDKDLILSNLEIHVAPKWDGNRYLNRGELRIYNILDSTYEFVDPY